MKYVIATKQWCMDKGIVIPQSARMSLDESMVILHKDFIDPVLNEGESISTYEHNSSELSEILNSSEWSKREEESILNI